jgi:circadian clock protein KaiC
VSGSERVSTGIEGLDTVLDGGLIEGRGYMVDGPPGVGKTILALHFLSAGLAESETVLFINLEEDIDDLRANARSLGFDVGAIELLDLSPTAEVFTEDRSYEVFSAAEVEQAPLTGEIRERVREVEPDRVVVDPLTQLRYLTSDDYQFRKQIIGFMRFLKRYGATVLFTVQDTDATPTEDLQFISDGTILFDRMDDRQTVAVPKFRGSATRGGEHTVRITDNGIEVFPALEPGNHRVSFESESISSGVPEIDELLHGGVERGTVSIISGATGVGKTTLGTQFMKEAAGRGERSVIYLFEENENTFLERSSAISIPVREMIDRGTLRVVEVEGMETTPQEFASGVRHEVETRDTRIVMIDGTVGYRQTLQGDREKMTQHLHALGRYLKNMGTTTILVEETGSVAGEFSATDSNLSYLADNIVFLRHLELRGELRKAIGVLKKRTTDFERTLREYGITGHGIKVGDPLTRVRGVLSGTPEVVERRIDDEG